MPKLFILWTTANCGKFLRKWEYHLTCLLKILHVGQKVSVRIRHGTLKYLKLGMEHDKM